MTEQQSDKIDKLFLNALNNDVFPGAAFAFSKWSEEGYRRLKGCYGLAQQEPEKKVLKEGTFFDLASLTKALATVPVLLALFQKKIFTAETRLAALLDSCPKDKRDITIGHLMSHSAGFVAHREYFHELVNLPADERKKYLLKIILAEELSSLPGKKHCYSDIGFMLLGLLVEQTTGKDIGQLAESLIYRPLGLQNDLYFPGLENSRGGKHVSTEHCPWTREMLCGRVHDDNCRAMGGVAGHAGLFGTVQGVIELCEQLLDQLQGRTHHPGYSNTLLRNAVRRVGDSKWSMGFDMVSDTGSSSGRYFSRESIGHLGFTGTSFWIDPERECIAVLLTNRVHPSRDNWKIKEFRPLFHDVLMKG